MRVESADADHPALGRQAVPLVEVLPRRVGHVALGPRDEAERVAHALNALAVVGHEAPHLDPVEAVEVVPRHRHPERAAAA